jgi:hypothetical protein
MGDPNCLMLSVRGEARVTVAPDFVVLSCLVVITRNSKAKALAFRIDGAHVGEIDAHRGASDLVGEQNFE